MNTIDDAIPAEYFANPPYRAELLSEKSGWAGVMNKAGFNCLRFKSKPGAVITNLETAEAIAEKWNHHGFSF
jgi:hypothetical protein